jgi:hypothetical protein
MIMCRTGPDSSVRTLVVRVGVTSQVVKRPTCTQCQDSITEHHCDEKQVELRYVFDIGRAPTLGTLANSVLSPVASTCMTTPFIESVTM